MRRVHWRCLACRSELGLVSNAFKLENEVKSALAWFGLQQLLLLLLRS